MFNDNICFECWKEAEDFFRKRKLKFHGYLPNEKNPGQGEFIFIPWDKSKEGIVSIKVKTLGDTLEGVEYEYRPFEFAKAEGCPKNCIDTYNTEDCYNKNCAGQIIREIMVLIKEKIIELQE